MKKIFGMGLILMLLVSVGWGQEAELYKVIPISPSLSPSLRVMATPPSWLDMVLPLSVCIGDVNGNPQDCFLYKAGQVWYMYFTFMNSSLIARSFKAEFSLYYGDGASYVNKRYSLSAPAATNVYYRVNVTAYIAKSGLITLVGRVYGAGMGNFSDIKSQVFVYN